MNEKQIQEVMALVKEFGKVPDRETLEEIESALREQPAAPVFEGVAKRKLDELLAQGHRIDGFAIAKFDAVPATHRGFITTGGMVGWWTSEEEIRRIERNAADRALREQVREVPDDECCGWPTEGCACLRNIEKQEKAPTQPAQAEQPPGVYALQCVISSLLGSSHFSDEEGELTEELKGLRDWVLSHTTAQVSQPKAAQWPIAPDVAAELERSNWTPEEALRWYAAGRHYDTVPNGDGTSSARILDNGAVASNALKSMSVEYAMHKGDVALLEQPKAAQQEPVCVAEVTNVVGAGPNDVGIRWRGGFTKPGTLLYTAAPQREPMTQEQINEGYLSQKLNGTPFENGVLYAERFHGITKKEQQ